MAPHRAVLALLVLTLGASGVGAAAPGVVGLKIFPPEVTLVGRGGRQQLLVTLDGLTSPRDRTRNAAFTSGDPRVVVVSPEGVVTPVGDGVATVSARADGFEATTSVRVSGAATFRLVTFERDVQPILARHGCNAGACHGKARGQNGFALSLLGFDSAGDYHAIVSEGRGRRLFPADPENSLFLRKAAGLASHGGGRKLPPGGPAYDLVRRWIVAGCPRTPAGTPNLVKITAEPGERLLTFKAEQQLVVTAHYEDGTREDVTHLATYQSNDSVFAAVDEHGRVKAGPLPGEAAIMARYQEKFAVTTVLVPQPDAVAAEVYASLPRNNFIDPLVYERLRRLNITPSGPASDATYHRRAYLDVIGRLPTPEECRTFLADPDPKKREKLIDALLERPEYADFWANKWADLLRPNPYRVGIKAVFNLDAFLRDSFRKNTPHDRFVREILTARGSTFTNGAAVVFRDRREPDEIVTLVSQLFLGVRLDCAKCHHHPFEVWSQDDFYSLAAYFARIGRKGVGLSPPISGGEEVLFTATAGEVKHPLTGKVLPPRPLFGTAPVGPDDEPRRALADWITSRENPYFARVAVNRVWADLMGRGIVEPVDDLRSTTNPPANGPLLDALAADFRKNGHDNKHLIRTICRSHVYALSSVAGPRNASDVRNHSRHYRERLRAEVLLDAVCDVTGTPEAFDAMPPGSRAMAVWTARSPSVFLDSFGRPDPNQDPPCERLPGTSVVQALHLMNAPALVRKLTAPEGRAAKLAASKLSDAELTEELYLLAYGRFPTPDEKAAAVRRFGRAGAKRQLVVEDILWAMINTPEFVFKD